MPFDLNPVKQSVLDEIEKCCRRNHNLDTVNDKSKNIVKMAEQQKQAAKQSGVLKNEVKQLKR